MNENLNHQYDDMKTAFKPVLRGKEALQGFEMLCMCSLCVQRHGLHSQISGCVAVLAYGIEKPGTNTLLQSFGFPSLYCKRMTIFCDVYNIIHISIRILRIEGCQDSTASHSYSMCLIQVIFKCMKWM